jgi:hypothetical protein
MSKPYWTMAPGVARDHAREIYCDQHPTPEERAARRALKRAARKPFRIVGSATTQHRRTKSGGVFVSKSGTEFPYSAADEKALAQSCAQSNIDLGPLTIARDGQGVLCLRAGNRDFLLIALSIATLRASVAAARAL